MPKAKQSMKSFLKMQLYIQKEDKCTNEPVKMYFILIFILLMFDTLKFKKHKSNPFINRTHTFNMSE